MIPPTTIDPAVAAMTRAINSPATLKIRLANMRSNYPVGPIVAVEGDVDKVVYDHWLSREVPGRHYEFFVCNGKRNAKLLAHVLSRDLSNLREGVSFIVDRDYDDLDGFPHPESIFMLDRYSFENYLVDDNVVDQVLILALPCNGFPDLRKSLVEMFQQDYSSFLAASRRLNRQIFIGRKLQMDIDKLIPNGVAGFASIEVGRVEAIDKDGSALLPLPFAPSADQLDKLDADFESLTPPLRYRGKYALRFLRTWLTELVAELKSGKQGLFSALGVGDHKVLSEELSIGAMARASAIPAGFKTFFEGRLDNAS